MKEFPINGHEPSILPADREWHLAFADEFDGTELDRDTWHFRRNYWGQVAEQFTDQGVSLDGESHVVFRPVIEDGMLKSAQLQTGGNSFDDMDLFGAIRNRLEGLNGDNPWKQIEIWPLRPLTKPSFMHRYGFYEARMKFQSRNFWWSAFWLQSPTIGASYDPAFSGVESDIIENFGDGKLTSGNIYGGYGKTFREVARIAYPFQNDGEFHRFGLWWSPGGYVFYFDGRETARTDGPVSQVEQFILLSTEIVGYRQGKQKTTWTDAELNDRFICDYVRVFDEVEP